MHKSANELWADIEKKSKQLSAANIKIQSTPSSNDVQEPEEDPEISSAGEQVSLVPLADQFRKLNLSQVGRDDLNIIIGVAYHELLGNSIGLDMLQYWLCQHSSVIDLAELKAAWAAQDTTQGAKPTLDDLKHLVGKYATVEAPIISTSIESTSKQGTSANVAVASPQITVSQRPVNAITIKTQTVVSQVTEKPVFALDTAKPLNPWHFPIMPQSAFSGPPAVIQNFKHLLDGYGITVYYDIIKKRLVINIPGLSGTIDNADNVSLAYLYNLCVLNGMNTGLLPTFITAIADRNQKNPVANWILSKPWDGVDRLPAFYDTLTERKDFPKKLKQAMMLRWSISGVAAAFKPFGFKARGVLTLQGLQSIGKSSWINNLVSDPMLREILIKLDLHLDPSNKDSVYLAASHWICELGELEGCFKKDVARLKGFLTNNMDIIRKPYDRAFSEYQRRTIFAASVNDSNFLVDNTGNTRFWTIPVTKIDYNHGIDMQQFWAQILTIYESGEQWWLTPEEEQELEQLNKTHRTVSAIHERILEAVDLEMTDPDELISMTASDMLRMLKYDKPTNPQFKDCNATMRELFGEPKRIKGYNKWRVPLRNASMLKQVFNDD